MTRSVVEWFQSESAETFLFLFVNHQIFPLERTERILPVKSTTACIPEIPRAPNMITTGYTVLCWSVRANRSGNFRKYSARRFYCFFTITSSRRRHRLRTFMLGLEYNVPEYSRHYNDVVFMVVRLWSRVASDSQFARLAGYYYSSLIFNSLLLFVYLGHWSSFLENGKKGRGEKDFLRREELLNNLSTFFRS